MGILDGAHDISLISNIKDDISLILHIIRDMDVPMHMHTHTQTHKNLSLSLSISSYVCIYTYASSTKNKTLCYANLTWLEHPA